MYTILLPKILKIGGGALKETPAILAQFGVQHPVIITDHYLAGNGMLDTLLEILTAGGMKVRCFTDSVPDPTVTALNKAVAFIKEGPCDAVIGFGGGSPIDTAKAAAVLAMRGGDIRALKAPHQEDQAGLPIIAIPTTAGTGSEATRFTIITDDVSDEKMLCVGAAYMPVAAIVDYELTLSMPARLTADTAIDALTHAIEAYVSKRATPFSDTLAISAMRTIWPNLRAAYADPGNRAAREGLMFGATQAGMAFSNASVALVHGMSRPIGAHFHVAHGLSNAMLLPVVTAWSVSAALTRYADCARVMNIATAQEGDQSAAARLVEELRRLNADLTVPTPKAYGLDEERWNALLPIMAVQALESGSPANNPRVPDAQTIQQLYREAWN